MISDQTELALCCSANSRRVIADGAEEIADSSGAGRHAAPGVRRVPMRDFSRSLPMSLLRAREAVMRQFRPSLRDHGLTEQQWRILRALAAIETIEVTELARVAFLLGPSLSRILRDLEARQLIERRTAKADLRRGMVSISGKGPEADRGGRAVVGSDLCRDHQALWRAQARRTAGHAARAGAQPVGTAGRQRRRRVSANLHDDARWTHSCICCCLSIVARRTATGNRADRSALSLAGI